MVCYLVPSAAALLHFSMRKRFPALRNDKHHLWLNQLFLGGAIFGVVDHWWNGELFLIGEKPVFDLALGMTITVVMVMVWKLMVIRDKMLSESPNKISG